MSDTYFTIENDMIVINIENDGHSFLRKGVELTLTSYPVNFSRYKDDERVKCVIEEWEKVNNKKFVERFAKEKDATP